MIGKHILFRIFYRYSTKNLRMLKSSLERIVKNPTLGERAEETNIAKFISA